MKLLTILTTVNGIFAINTRLDPSSTDECTTQTGTVIPAGNFHLAIFYRIFYQCQKMIIFATFGQIFIIFPTNDVHKIKSFWFNNRKTFHSIRK